MQALKKRIEEAKGILHFSYDREDCEAVLVDYSAYDELEVLYNTRRISSTGDRDGFYYNVRLDNGTTIKIRERDGILSAF